MVQSKVGFKTNKDHGTTLDAVRSFNKPNLDDGNRFYNDNLSIYKSFTSMKRELIPDERGLLPTK